MKYHTYDVCTKLLQPGHQFAQFSHSLLSHPFNPLAHTPLGKMSSAFWETLSRATKTYDKIGFNIRHVTTQGRICRVTEKICTRKTFCHLLHFSHYACHKKPRLLILAPLSGHHATLLKGTVETLLTDFDIYITDWLDARDIPLAKGDFHFDDYVRYVIEFLEQLGPDTHLFAVCQPAVQALIATAVMAEQQHPAAPCSVILIAGPIDPRVSPTEVNSYAVSHDLTFFKRHAISTVPEGYAGAGRKVYPGFLQLASFINMNLGSHLSKQWQFMSDIVHGDHHSSEAHRTFYDEYLAVMDMTAEFYLETIDRVFLDPRLPQGKMYYAGKPVKPSAITKTALLTIEGAQDDICGPGQTRAAQKLCKNLAPSMKKHHTQKGVGHYGVFNGSTFREQIAPMIAQFANEQSARTQLKL